jgi:hypothetical protein
MTNLNTIGEDVPTPPILYKIPNISDRILLDVGGVHYSTTLATLTSQPFGYLASMFSGEWSVEPDSESGRYFIDRNGRLFHYILDYLRNGTIVLPSDPNKKKQILIEADWFGLDLLTQEEKLVATAQNGEHENVCNEVQTGGTARAVHITGHNGATIYNAGTLNGHVGANWTNNGCLFDEAPTNLITSVRVNPSGGTTWVNASPGLTIGELVIDLGKTCSISRFDIYAMRSDGQVTDARIFAHSDLTPNIVPNDSWEEIVPWTPIAMGVDTHGDATQLTSPTTVSLDEPVITRYLMLQAKNDGRNGNPSYIEVRQLRAWAQ